MGLLSSVEQTANVPFITNYCSNVLYTIPLLALLFPLIAYFSVNMVNIIKATDAYYVIAATLMCIGQYWFLVVQKPELRHLVHRLQYLVDQSELWLILATRIVYFPHLINEYYFFSLYFV